MPRPRVTFSRNGITSSGPSGPPNETSRKASYAGMAPSNQDRRPGGSGGWDPSRGGPGGWVPPRGVWGDGSPPRGVWGDGPAGGGGGGVGPPGGGAGGLGPPRSGGVWGGLSPRMPEPAYDIVMIM